MLKVKFWGTGGSLPKSQDHFSTRRQIINVVQEALKHNLGSSLSEVESFVDSLPFHQHGSYGGATSCVQLVVDFPEYFIFDLGSGLWDFSNECISSHGDESPQTYNLFLSHLHYDHIMGFPFFSPAFNSSNTIRFIGCHKQLESAFYKYYAAPYFPISFEDLKAKVEFVVLDLGQEYDISGLKVAPFKHYHFGDSYGYRVTVDNKTFVYSTDSELFINDVDHIYDVVSQFKDANLVVFDSMYRLKELVASKKGWGHSSSLMGVDLCLAANVEKLYLFHHDPVNTNQELDEVLEVTRTYENHTRGDRQKLDIFMSYDGLEVPL